MSDHNAKLLTAADTIYMIGICGVGMTAVAQVLQGWGKNVSGCDAEEEFPTHAVLSRLAIPVTRGFTHASIPHGTDLVVVSTAYRAQHPVVAMAMQAEISVMWYDEALSALTHGKHLIAVTGTHGKTTTTAMIGRMLEEAGYDPTVIVGAMVKEWGSNARVGRGEWMVVEADEYQGKFNTLSPHVLVITSIDWDHPDYYTDAESYRDAFADRIQSLRADALVVGYGDDIDVLEVIADGRKRAITYGRAHHRDMRIIEESHDETRQTFWVLENTHRIGPFQLSRPGSHMVSNALAAITVALEVGAPFSSIQRALESFEGAGRRMETIGNLPNGALIIDDYAHHPVEVSATLCALKSWYPERTVTVVFQAHTFSRTQALLEEFSHAFNDADHVVITTIFASARESAGTITSEEFAQAIGRYHSSVVFTPFEQLEDFVRSTATGHDLWVFMGAGDGWKVARSLISDPEGGHSADASRNSRPDRDRDRAQPTDHNSPTADRSLKHLTASQNAPLPDTRVRDQLALLVEEKNVEEGVALAKYTTFRIGGPATWFVHARSQHDITAVAGFAREHNIPVLILSGGSNMLVSDNGWDGIVIRCEDRSFTIEGETVVAGSGVPLQFLATESAKQGLVGAEFCATIPGAVGGAVRGNAGAFGREMKDIVNTVKIWDGEQVRILNNTDCAFRYRGSVIKEYNYSHSIPWIILSVAIQLTKGDPVGAQELIKTLLTKKAETQSIEKPSAGCLFKNIETTSDFWQDPIRRQWQNRVPAEFKERQRIPAAWLIDHAELKGKRIGGVEVSMKHANYVNNVGSARAEDVIMLISIIKQKIRTKYGVQLEEEVEMVGF